MLGPTDARIRERLRAARPNQRRLAERLGKSQSWVSKYMRGGNVIADPDALVAIAAFLQTTVSDLIGEAAVLPRKTTPQRRAEEIAELWLGATPAVRRQVRQYLEGHHGGTQKGRRVGRS